MRAKRVDANHAEIRDGLRARGYTITDLSSVGKGIPDLMVSLLPGIPYFLEIKDGAKRLSKQKLTDEQKKWSEVAWLMTSKVSSLDEAVSELEGAAFSFSYIDGREK